MGGMRQYMAVTGASAVSSRHSSIAHARSGAQAPQVAACGRVTMVDRHHWLVGTNSGRCQVEAVTATAIVDMYNCRKGWARTWSGVGWAGLARFRRQGQGSYRVAGLALPRRAHNLNQTCGQASDRGSVGPLDTVNAGSEDG